VTVSKVVRVAGLHLSNDEKRAVRITKICTNRSRTGAEVDVTFGGNIEQAIGNGHLRRVAVGLVASANGLRSAAGGHAPASSTALAEVVTTGPTGNGRDLASPAVDGAVVRQRNTISFFMLADALANDNRLNVAVVALAPVTKRAHQASGQDVLTTYAHLLDSDGAIAMFGVVLPSPVGKDCLELQDLISKADSLLTGIRLNMPGPDRPVEESELVGWLTAARARFNKLCNQAPSTPSGLSPTQTTGTAPPPTGGTTAPPISGTTPQPQSMLGFAPLPPFALGNSPTSINIDDLNGDGKPDIITGLPGGITILPGNGDLTFRSQINITLPSSGPVTSIATGNISGGVRPDLLAASGGSASSSLYLLTQSGSGFGFSSPTQIPFPGGSPNKIVLAQLNGQSGGLGLVVGSFGGLFYADPASTPPFFQSFQRVPLNYTDNFRDIVQANLNGNGNPTFLATEQFRNAILELDGDGKGGLIPGPEGNAGHDPVAVTTWTSSRNVFAATANGGGVAGNNMPPYDITVDRRTPTGWSTVGNTQIGNSAPTSITSFYYQNMTYVLVLAGTRVQLLQANPDGSLQPAQAFPIGSSTPARQLAIGDLNGDGTPDLAITNLTGNVLDVLKAITVTGS
jgi:hypothetical protein